MICIGLMFIALQNAVASARTILVFGDSLSAAHGLRPEQGWVALLDARLKAQGYEYQVINASESGETTTGGLARLPRELRLTRPGILILELGANDALRGLPLALARQRLGEMIRVAEAAGARVLLIGLLIPPNYGPRYARQFADIYPDLARQFHTALVPFLLKGVALDPDLMQRDGLHPNARGEPLVLDNVWPYLAPMLKKTR
ncbi:MAG TPA: arylesterase [Steroidobacteraceae bacterium]|nr:arylesterase [Steroidobacteraceae bacterium]